MFLKLAMNRMGKFSLSWKYFGDLLVNWQLFVSGMCMVAATGLWLHIIRNFPFSVAYPLTSISYVFGMLAAVLVFHETIPATRWIGVLLVMAGVILIAK
ncbi:hypothetical protein FACS189438_2570 [Bacteroidia bacterium]|nr:hypothetical protein FACS189438_2570 [Bacteroidia bacterium]